MVTNDKHVACVVEVNELHKKVDRHDGGGKCMPLDLPCNTWLLHGRIPLRGRGGWATWGYVGDLPPVLLYHLFISHHNFFGDDVKPRPLVSALCQPLDSWGLTYHNTGVSLYLLILTPVLEYCLQFLCTRLMPIGYTSRRHWLYS